MSARHRIIIALLRYERSRERGVLRIVEIGQEIARRLWLI